MNIHNIKPLYHPDIPGMEKVSYGYDVKNLALCNHNAGSDDAFCGSTLSQWQSWANGERRHPLSDVIEIAYKSTSFTKNQKIVNDVDGFAPDVSAYCAGEPDSMLNLSDAMSDVAPITAWVDVGVSASVKADDINKSRVRLMSFLYALSSTRPVRMITFFAAIAKYSGECSAGIVTNEVDLSGDAQSVALAFDSRTLRGTFFHTLCKTVDSCGRYGGSLNWIIDTNGNQEEQYRDLLCADKRDIVVPGIYSKNGTINDAWLSTQMDKYGISGQS